jgi:hypothetical protein
MECGSKRPRIPRIYPPHHRPPTSPKRPPPISQRSLLRPNPGPTSGTICPCKGVGRRADVRMHSSFLKSGLVVGSRGVARGIQGRQWRRGQREGEAEREGVWWEFVGDLRGRILYFSAGGTFLKHTYVGFRYTPPPHFHFHTHTHHPPQVDLYSLLRYIPTHPCPVESESVFCSFGSSLWPRTRAAYANLAQEDSVVLDYALQG